MAEITLDNEILQALIDPEKGAGVMALFAKQDGSLLPLMPDARQESAQLDSSCFLMIPYSNRIENGTFSFEREKYRLADGENHALHGDTRFRAWSTEEVTATRISCEFHSSVYPDINWHWPFEAYVEYSLDENVFSSQLILWNRGGSRMPAGFGWHPYFNRNITREGEPVHLCMKVRSAYPDANDNRIPSGPAGPVPPEQDFSKERPLSPDYFIDTCFQGYDGNGYITWPESRIKLSFSCSPVCTHLVMYNPLNTPYFAVEPVTNANNGVNLLGRGEPDSGVVVLAPGESLEARFEMRVN